MNSWTMNDALDYADLDTLDLHYPSSDYINYSSPAVKHFISAYRNKYNSDPGYYAFQGYDIGWFYFTMLQMYGIGFQQHLADFKYKGLHIDFNYFKPSEAGGFRKQGGIYP